MNQPDNFDAILKKGLDNLFHLSEIYEAGDSEEKRKVIGSVYPEKLTFDGDQLRTTRINEAVRLIYTLDKELAEKEKGQNGNFSILSSQVGKTGFEPATPWSQTRCATGLRYFPNGGSRTGSLGRAAGLGDEQGSWRATAGRVTRVRTAKVILYPRIP